MDQVTIVVVTRGKPVEEHELMAEDDKNLITPYYKSKAEQTKIQWSAVRRYQNARYQNDRDEHGRGEYDIWHDIQALDRVEFTVSEFSSSILRKLVKGEKEPLTKEEITALLSSLEYFNTELSSEPNEMINDLISMKDSVSEENVDEIKTTIFQESNLPIIVGRLTPIPLAELSAEYSNHLALGKIAGGRNKKQKYSSKRMSSKKVVVKRKPKSQTRKIKKPFPKRRTRK
jgi:hypothetical protein